MVDGIGFDRAAGVPQLAKMVIPNEHELPNCAPGDRAVPGMLCVALLRRRLPSRWPVLGRAVWHDLLEAPWASLVIVPCVDRARAIGSCRAEEPERFGRSTECRG